MLGNIDAAYRAGGEARTAAQIIAAARLKEASRTFRLRTAQKPIASVNGHREIELAS